jgi:DNA-binding transcriptional MocR family regulator
MMLRYVDRAHFERTGQMEARPSQVRMAQECGGTPDGVRKAFLQAARAGLITIKPGSGRRSNSRYIIHQVAAPPYAETPDSLLAIDAETPDARLKNPRPLSEKPQTDQGTNPVGIPDVIHEERAAPFAKLRSLPADFPDDDAKQQMADRFAAVGLPVDVDHAAAKFRAHHKARGRPSADWSANWDTWILDELKYTRDRIDEPRSAPARQTATQLAARGER